MHVLVHFKYLFYFSEKTRSQYFSCELSIMICTNCRAPSQKKRKLSQMCHLFSLSTPFIHLSKYVECSECSNNPISRKLSSNKENMRNNQFCKGRQWNYHHLKDYMQQRNFHFNIPHWWWDIKNSGLHIICSVQISRTFTINKPARVIAVHIWCADWPGSLLAS